MKMRYDQPSMEEYQRLIEEERMLIEFVRRLDLYREYQEARNVRMELRFIAIKKTCYKAALKLDQKRKAAARRMQTA